MMPEMDGFEFAEELRRHEAWRTIPILVVTAKDLSDRERQLPAPATSSGSWRRARPRAASC